jgi:hypothetical protein
MQLKGTKLERYRKVLDLNVLAQSVLFILNSLYYTLTYNQPYIIAPPHR